MTADPNGRYIVIEIRKPEHMRYRILPEGMTT